MKKKSKYFECAWGATTIRPGNNYNLQVNWDFNGQNKLNKKRRIPVLLFTPNMEEAVFDHYHIELSRKQAEKLRDWLTDYLKDISK